MSDLRSFDKAILRRRFRAERLALTPDAYADASARIVARLLALPEVAAARTVHTFWPLVERREPDLRPFVAALQARGVRVVLPFVAALDPPTLRHRALVGAAPVPDANGLPSGDGPDVPLAGVDVVVVPALAVDRRGVRLGYGKGFYDRMLAGLALPTVCPVFGLGLVDVLPTLPTDVPVGVVVTEDAVLRLQPPGEASDP